MSIQISLLKPSIPIVLNAHQQRLFVIETLSRVKEDIYIYLSCFDKNGNIQTIEYMSSIKVLPKEYMRHVLVFNIKQPGVFFLSCFTKKWMRYTLFWNSPTFSVI